MLGVLQIFDGCPGDHWSVYWKYLIGVLEIFDGCPVHILLAELEVFDR